MHTVGRTLAVAIALALVAGACGGDSPGEASAESVGENAEPEPTADSSTTTSTALHGAWPVSTSPDGAYSMALPRGWELTTLEGDPAEIEDGVRVWELAILTWSSDRSQGLSDRTALSFTPSSGTAPA